jgi:hypothetical protein
MDAQALGIVSHREPQQLAGELSAPAERLWSDLGNIWRVPALAPGESRLPIRRPTVQALRDARFVQEIALGQVQPLSILTGNFRRQLWPAAAPHLIAGAPERRIRLIPDDNGFGRSLALRTLR